MPNAVVPETKRQSVQCSIGFTKYNKQGNQIYVIKEYDRFLSAKMLVAEML